MELGLYPGSVEHAPGETLLVLLPEDERPPAGDAGLIDWRLAGEISKKLHSGYVSGARGDAALLQGRAPLCAKRVLLQGVGPAEPLREGPPSVVAAMMQGAMQQLRAIHSRYVLLALPQAVDFPKRAPELLRGLLQSLANAEAPAVFRLVVPDAARNAPALESAVSSLLHDAHVQGIDLQAGWVTPDPDRGDRLLVS